MPHAGGDERTRTADPLLANLERAVPLPALIHKPAGKATHRNHMHVMWGHAAPSPVLPPYCLDSGRSVLGRCHTPRGIPREGGVTEAEALFAVVDLETTGFSPLVGDRIVEVAIIRVAPSGEWTDEYVTLVNPKRDVGAS